MQSQVDVRVDVRVAVEAEAAAAALLPVMYRVYRMPWCLWKT